MWGVDATREAVVDEAAAAIDLARFLFALHGTDASGGPPPGEHNFYRGEPLARRDKETRAAIERLEQCGEIERPLALAAWGRSVSDGAGPSRPVWIHGDLHPGNVLVNDGKISGVIDFGGLAAGDPACDLMAAWTLFSGSGRRTMRRTLAVDDATWLRGRGWALTFGVVALDHYRHTNAELATIARHAIQQVLADVRAELRP